MATKAELKKIFVTGAIPKQKDFHDLIDLAGKQGPKGDPGDKGDPGADGFGTEAQYNDIIARLEALENPAEKEGRFFKMDLQKLKQHIRVDHSFEDNLLREYMEWGEAETNDSVSTS